MYSPRDIRISFAKSLFLVASAGVLTGCPLTDDEENEKPLYPSENYAIISTAASDYSSGNISIISIVNGCTNDETQDLESNEKYRCFDNHNFSGLSDVRVSAHEDSFYRIGRYQQNNITKLKIDARTDDDFLWQFSTLDEGEIESNPYKLVVKDENTAFLIRYGQSSIWIVNPSVGKTASTEEFKIGEIDLSSYTEGDADISPEAADAVLIDNKLYVLMQNQDTSAWPWVPRQAYIAIFDTENDNVEIQTNDDTSTPNGIALLVENPMMMEYLTSNNSLYIAGAGSYAPNYEGGIERVSLLDYSTSLIVDDGDTESHPYGQIDKLAISSSMQGYFVGYHARDNNALYSFNPATGEVDETPLLENNSISDIEIGPLGNLWVTNRNESGITIFDTDDNSIAKTLISTNLKPNNIVFITNSEN